MNETKELNNQAQIVVLAHKNPKLFNIMERVITGASTYGDALEEAVIALAEQVQALQDTYRGKIH